MTSRLDEVKFSDLTDLGDALRTHAGKGRYIHFSRQNKRLGVNTKSHHGDPKGVYFYPVDWLLASRRFHAGDQWGTNMPYWFICDIDLSKPGLDLDTLTVEKARELGERNGWWDQFSEMSSFAAQPAPGQISKALWAYLKGLNSASTIGNIKHMSWLRSLKGEAWIKDTQGVVMIYEPSQVCVLDPRCMRLVDSGQQPELNTGNSDTFVYWRKVVVQIMTDLARNHGGEVKWQRGIPIMTASGQGWKFVLNWDRYWGGVQLVAETEMGSAHERHVVTWKELKALDVPEIEERIEEWLIACENFDGEDVQFTPYLSREQVSDYLKSQFVGLTDTDVPVEWDVSNSTHMLWGELKRTGGMPPVNTMARVGVDDDSAWIRLDIKINSRLLLSVNNAPLDDFHTMFWKELSPERVGEFRIELTRAGYWDIFLGWIGHYSGLAILEPYEDKFLNCKEKRELYRLIDLHFCRLSL